MARYIHRSHSMCLSNRLFTATEPPYDPSLIRLPGYPLFLAGVYSIFGHQDNTAVRIVQALIDTATCVLIALIAFFWEPDEKLKRRSSIAALVLASICPFTTIYVATILTETITVFLAVAMCWTATLAFRATRPGKAVLLWGATGFIAGLDVLFRPDSGLFAAAIGITWCDYADAFQRREVNKKRQSCTIFSGFILGAVFSLAFCLCWFPDHPQLSCVSRFQPLAPAHAEMPGSLLPRGYHSGCARDRRWTLHRAVLWALDESPIKLGHPDRASIPRRKRASCRVV